jgi:hypothetical protein
VQNTKLWLNDNLMAKLLLVSLELINSMCLWFHIEITYFTFQVNFSDYYFNFTPMGPKSVLVCTCTNRLQGRKDLATIIVYCTIPAHACCFSISKFFKKMIWQTLIWLKQTTFPFKHNTVTFMYCYRQNTVLISKMNYYIVCMYM